MKNIISNFVFLILIFLLQSCSGGKIGNFLESSFRNNNVNRISPNNIDKELKNDIVDNNKSSEENDKVIEKELNNEIYSQIKDNSSSLKKIDYSEIKKENKNYEPKSYRIFLILKKVDPSFPIENFSKFLRDGNINFEIEKIELIPELNKNKK
tara:strand:+ start:160 stop:618 length:459 start_codon:yes stop_codon:yes gene_type:complete